MTKLTERGYVVRENGPVYYTKSMDQATRWFEEILGWYSEIDERDSDGNGLYGCVYDLPREIEKLHVAPFRGIHLFYGEPKGDLVAFLQVQGIDALHAYVTARDWSGITPVAVEPWGAKVCTITTPDGCQLRFFEPA